MMNLPDEVSKLLQKYLGKQALATQKLHGRGAWFVTRKDARYVRQKDLIALTSKLEVDELMKMIREFDPNKQAVVIFEFEEGAMIIDTIDIEARV